MPLYNYICSNEECESKTFEVLTTFEETTERCPKCKETTKERESFYQFSFYMD